MTAITEGAHSDLLNQLNKKSTVSDKIAFIHQVVRGNYGFVHRIGVAVYERQSDMLKTFAHSNDGDNPLGNYQCRLSEAGSLYRIFREGRPRVVNDLTPGSGREHTRRIMAHGYRASYTVPMFQDDRLTGFVFFNSREAGVFREDGLPYLDMIARLISLLVSVELSRVQTLYGALRMATCFSGHKDPETGAHLERMARFSRLIAGDVARDYGLTDEFVEAVFWFAPMHDVGKIAIPDRIIRKPGKLTEEEFAVMRTHTTRGRQIVAAMLGHFNLDRAGLVSMIGNIAECHHENMDGSGYPRGLKGDEIPVEARIVAVADVFDALTSERCYKQAWSNEEACEALAAMATWKLDARCVQALVNRAEEVRAIQAEFRDEQETLPAGALPCLALPADVSILDAIR